MSDLDDFVDALNRVAAGGTALDIFTKLGLAPTGTDHRRVLAVLRYLGTS